MSKYLIALSRWIDYYSNQLSYLEQYSLCLFVCYQWFLTNLKLVSFVTFFYVCRFSNWRKSFKYLTNTFVCVSLNNYNQDTFECIHKN